MSPQELLNKIVTAIALQNLQFAFSSMEAANILKLSLMDHNITLQYLLEQGALQTIAFCEKPPLYTLNPAVGPDASTFFAERKLKECP